MQHANLVYTLKINVREARTFGRSSISPCGKNSPTVRMHRFVSSIDLTEFNRNTSYTPGKNEVLYLHTPTKRHYLDHNDEHAQQSPTSCSELDTLSVLSQKGTGNECQHVSNIGDEENSTCSLLSEVSVSIINHTPTNIPNSPNHIPTNILNSLNHIPTNIPNSPNHIPTNIPNSPNQIPTNIPNSPNHIPTNIPNSPNHIPTDIHNSPNHILTNIPNSPNHIPTNIPNSPNHIPTNIPNSPNHIPTDIPNSPNHILTNIPNSPNHIPTNIPNSPNHVPTNIPHHFNVELEYPDGSMLGEHQPTRTEICIAKGTK